MPEFCTIIARKTFHIFFLGGGRAPYPISYWDKEVKYAAIYRPRSPDDCDEFITQ